MESRLHDECADALAALSRANQAFAKSYSGERPDRQPIHTVYGGAHLFKAETAQKLGELAVRSLDEYAPDAATLASALGIERKDLAERVYERVRQKLEREAVEDFRIDFEDGYGNRPDEEEDATAVAAAKEVARGMKEGGLPPFLGIRIKPLNAELEQRSVRTLDIFLTTLVGEAGRVPDRFVVTLPKVPIPEQVTALVRMFEALEKRLGLAAGTLRMELMIELTQAILGPDGRSTLPLLRAAAGERLLGRALRYVRLHRELQHHRGVPADRSPRLRLRAPHDEGRVREHRRVAVGRRDERDARAGPPRARRVRRSPRSRLARTAPRSTRRGGCSYDNVRHSLENGFYQGWDLHPAQLPIRYAATYAFFLEGFEAAADRLRNFVEKAAQATLVGDVFDDAATGQGLLNYFLRGLSCGAVSLEELGATGLTEGRDRDPFVREDPRRTEQAGLKTRAVTDAACATVARSATVRLMPGCSHCGLEHPSDELVCPVTEQSMHERGPCGARIDRYEVESWLGGGGFGAVYRARHAVMDRPVALKILHTKQNMSQRAVERFFQEAKAAAAIGHPDIIQVFDAGVTPDGTSFLAMELVEGCSLHDLLEVERLPPERAVSIALGVLGALEAAHAAGIVHRDVKPGNIMLGGTTIDGSNSADHVKLLDFGISKVKKPGEGMDMTRSNIAMGSPGYAAPEQYLSARDVDARADVYGVGVVLYRTLSGQLPFDVESYEEMVVRACTSEPAPLASRAPEVPPALATVVDRAIAREREARHVSARAFAAALRAAAADLGADTPSAGAPPDALAPTIATDGSGPYPAVRASTHGSGRWAAVRASTPGDTPRTPPTRLGLTASEPGSVPRAATHPTRVGPSGRSLPSRLALAVIGVGAAGLVGGALLFTMHEARVVRPAASSAVPPPSPTPDRDLGPSREDPVVPGPSEPLEADEAPTDGRARPTAVDSAALERGAPDEPPAPHRARTARPRMRLDRPARASEPTAPPTMGQDFGAEDLEPF